MPTPVPFSQYHVVEEKMLEAFIMLVNNRVKDGWQLYGEMIAFPNLKDAAFKETKYIQVLVKVKK
jgi:hypothetical protein